MGNCQNCCRYDHINNVDNSTNNIELNKIDLIELKICSFNVRLFQSVNHVEKIENLIDFVIKSDYNVICLQGINDIKLLRLIVKNIFKYNLTTQTNKLTTYPVIESFYMNYVQDDVLKVTWSNSNDDDIEIVDSLIITKENIISGSHLEMTSFELNGKGNRFYVINIEWNNIVVSVYNTTFQSDFVGISNEEIRKVQIKELWKVISENTKNIHNSVNIVCCQCNIKELFNNRVSGEYLNFTRTLKSLDTYRYVQTLKGININSSLDATDLSGSRNNYILLSNLNTSNFDNLKNIGDELYVQCKLLVTNSTIKKFKLYEDRAIVTTFVSVKNMNLLNEKERSLTIYEDIAIEIV